MQEGPRVEKCPIAIQFLGTYVTSALIAQSHDDRGVGALTVKTYTGQ